MTNRETRGPQGGAGVVPPGVGVPGDDATKWWQPEGGAPDVTSSLRPPDGNSWRL